MKAYVDELIRRGRLSASWLAAQVDEEGYIPAENDLACYYKCVLPLRLAGYSIEAARVLDRIMKLHYREDGDLRNSADQKTSGAFDSVFCQVYPNGWITLGAHSLGRFDVVRLLMRGVMDNYYDEEMGTLRCSCLPRVDLFDVNSGAIAVQLFLLTDLPRARRAAHFLLEHIRNQPEPDRWYYNRIEKPFNYITAPDARSPIHVAIEIGRENQAYGLLGLPAAALTQLYEVTGESEYLEGAKRFFETFLSCGEPGFRGRGSGKSFWCASMLYRLTGEKKYLENAKKLMDFFFSIQQDDGTFLLPGMKREDATSDFLYNTTPEYTRWFFEVATELASA